MQVPGACLVVDVGYGSASPELSMRRSIPSLVGTHSLGEESLRRVHRLGGLVCPSLAVTRPEWVPERFGEITLVAPTSLWHPEVDRTNRVFAGNVYLPCHLAIVYMVEEEHWERLKRRVALASGWNDVLLDACSFTEGGLNYLAASPSVLAAFLRERGLDASPESKSELRQRQRMATAGAELLNRTSSSAWVIRKDSDVNVELSRRAFRTRIQAEGLSRAFSEYVWQLYESLSVRELIFSNRSEGGRRYLLNTAQNVFRLTRRSTALSAERSAPGVDSLLACFAPRLRSLASVLREADRLVPGKVFEEERHRVRDTLADIEDGLCRSYPAVAEKYHGTEFSDRVVTLIKAVGRARGDAESRKVVCKEYDFARPPETLLRRIGQYADCLRHMPIEYFEAKPFRVVRIQEFEAALVPVDCSADVRRLLRDTYRLPVFDYEQGGNAGITRQEMLAGLAAEAKGADHSGCGGGAGIDENSGANDCRQAQTR